MWAVVALWVVALAAAGLHRASLPLLFLAAGSAAFLAVRASAGAVFAGVVAGAGWMSALGPWSADRLVVAGAAVVGAASLIAWVRPRWPRVAAVVAVLAVATSGLALRSVPTNGRMETDDRLREVDAFVRAEVGSGQVPGLAVVVVERGRVVFSRAYGGDRQTPMTTNTPVVIGSTSKSITALAVVQLAEKGLLELDAPISDYLPWLEPVDERVRTITVRQLLVDTSGIPTWAGWNALAGDGRRVDSSLRQLVNNLRLAGDPGQGFRYSNANYIILGQIIETVTKTPFADVVSTNIFEPLRMTNTSAGPSRKSVAHRYWFGMPLRSELPYLEVGIPAGAIISTASDLALYVQAQLGQSPGPRWISESTLDLIHAPAVKAEGFGVPAGRHYAMGWYTGTVANRRAVFHSGDVFDSSSSVVLLPDMDAGVVVVATTSNPLVPVAKTIAEGVTATLVGEAPPRFGRPLATSSLVAITIAGLVLAFAVARATRLGGRRPTSRGAMARLAIIDIAVPGLVVFGLTLAFSHYLDRAETMSAIAFWRLLGRGVPDLALLILAALLVRVIAAIAALAARAR